MNEHKKLWAAVIHRAVLDIKENKNKDKALAWSRAKKTQNNPLYGVALF